VERTHLLCHLSAERGKWFRRKITQITCCRFSTFHILPPPLINNWDPGWSLLSSSWISMHVVNENDLTGFTDHGIPWYGNGLERTKKAYRLLQWLIRLHRMHEMQPNHSLMCKVSVHQSVRLSWMHRLTPYSEADMRLGFTVQVHSVQLLPNYFGFLLVHLPFRPPSFQLTFGTVTNVNY